VIARRSLTVRPSSAADLPGILRLHATRFGQPLDPEVWSWKYDRLPGLSRSVVALDGCGAVVAHAGALALEARSATAVGLLWQLVDFVGTTRGGGLRSAMVEAGRALLDEIPRPQDLPFVFGFPGERHFRLGERAYGYREVRTIPFLEGSIPDSEGGEVEIGDHCGSWVEETWEACAANGVRRSAAFLNWRYHARPDRYYRFYRLPSSSGSDGLMVFAFEDRLAKAAEVWLPPGGSWAAAVAGIASDLRAMGMVRWRFWPPVGREAVRLLDALGVSATGDGLFLGCRAGKGRAEPEVEAAALHYSMGDYDCT